MPRFSAEALDVSRLPPPQAIQTIDYEAILAARIADLKVRLDLVGVQYDVGELETDPLKVLEETDSGREVLALTSINNAVRAVMVPLAVGADLDHLASWYGVARMTGETDARFRLRVLLAPEAFASAGPMGAYFFHALTADSRVKDAGVRTVESTTEISGGRTGIDRVVEVVVLSTESDGTPSSEVLAAVRARLKRTDIKPLTDVVSVLAAEIENYTVTATLYVPPGPDPALILTQANAAIDLLAAESNKVGRILYQSAIEAALHVGGVRQAVLSSPVTDIGDAQRQAPRLLAKNLTVQVRDE